MVLCALRRWLRPVRRLLDRAITSHGFLGYQTGAMDRCLNDPEVARLYNGHKFVLFRRHYYLPLPDAKDIEFLSDNDLVGVTIDDDACFDFYRKFVAPYNQKFRGLALAKNEGADTLAFRLLNGSFMAIDGNVYYGLIRSLAPGKIIEVGSGNSTRLACLAIRKIVAECRQRTELVCIEPFHAAPLREIPEATSVLWPGNHLMVRHEDRMRSLFEPEYSMMRAEYPLSEPATFWMRVN